MDATNIKVVAHKTGLVTQGVTPELDLACRATHQKFLDAHHLTYWQLVILQVFGTPYVVIFSGHGELPVYGTIIGVSRSCKDIE
jgi:hypothetical protein